MAEKSTFFNSVAGDRKYKAEDIAAHFSKLITNGVYPSGTQLQAIEDTGMDVTVSAGSAWINGYTYHNDSNFTLTFDAADGVLNRIDRIVVRWGRVARSINLAIIKGTPAISPTAPPIVRNADYYDLSIATVYIGAGITAITQAMITDTRGDSTVCGFVSSLIQPDTSGWFAQFESAFNAWFDTVQDILDEEAAGNLLNLINDLAGAGRTTETVKGVADAQASHEAEDATTGQKGHVQLQTSVDNSEVKALTPKALDDHSKKLVSYQTFVTRDLSLTGTQKITLPFKAKSIQIKVTNGTLDKSYSDGFCDEALNQRCTYVYPSGTDTAFNTNGTIIRFTVDNSNVTDGNISLIEDDGITITWSKIGSGATGTAVVNILAMTH